MVDSFKQNWVGIIVLLILLFAIDSYINHDNFFSVNKVLKEYDDMKEEIEKPKYSEFR